MGSSWEFLGTLIPNLWDCLLVLLLTALLIMYIFLRVNPTHHLKAVFSSICCAFTYYATLTGFDYFKTASCTQVVVPYFHRMQNNHPLIVFFCCCLPFTTTIMLALLIAIWSFLWSVVASISSYRFPFLSYCEYMFCAIMFATNSFLVPLGKLTS